ncbi:cytochrome b5-like [Tribolium madens]|uniref:cytochrome b5-like n=1 Tax=Tribolium madens TaxID=41895 RepID=UPI001CF75F76|nr:cytochrome b5-like [Tribolium madens]
METKYFSLEEIGKNNGKDGNKTWILIKNNVYDVTEYLDGHPGGGELITEWAGKECTKAFDDAGHSGDAKKELKRYKIGELREEDRKQKKSTTISNPKEDRRSFCSYLTCGLCA